MKALKILIVEDSKITAKKLASIFSELGHEVVGTVNNGIEAVSNYEEYHPDLVTMDITMPGMDGIEATKRILDIDPDAVIIIVTSHGQENTIMDAIEDGALGYVLKPFNKEKIREQLEVLQKEYL
jgi:two-component system chemotaxis response regulator CheY